MRRRRRTSRRPRRTMMPGFGATEEVVEEAVETQEARKGKRSAWPTILAVGSVGFIGLGMLYGLSRASTPGAARYKWGGIG